MREVVVGRGRRGGAVRSGALQDAMHQVQDGERQTSDGRRSQRPSRRPIQLPTCRQGIIYHARPPAPGQWHDKDPSAGRRISAMREPTPEAKERWLGPGVAGIGTASFLADVGHEIPSALLPNLLTATLGAPAAALGLIEGVSDGLAGAARLAGEAIADDPRRRRAQAVAAYTTTAVLSSLIGAATAVWQVAVLRAGAWAARGLRVPARNALLADIVPAAVYGRAYGFERAMDNLGAIAGPSSPWPWLAWSGSAPPSPGPSSPACSPPCHRLRHPPRPTSRAARTPTPAAAHPARAHRTPRPARGRGLGLGVR